MKTMTIPTSRLYAGKLRSETAAFARIAMFMARYKPFRDQPAHRLVDTISGAVRRGHYVVGTIEGRLCGCACWGLSSEDVAQRWLAGTYAPRYEETLDGDVVVLIAGAASHPGATRHFYRYMAGLYPGRAYATLRLGRKRAIFGRFPAHYASHPAEAAGEVR